MKNILYVGQKVRQKEVPRDLLKTAWINTRPNLGLLVLKGFMYVSSPLESRPFRKVLTSSSCRDRSVSILCTSLFMVLAMEDFWLQSPNSGEPLFPLVVELSVAPLSSSRCKKVCSEGSEALFRSVQHKNHHISFTTSKNYSMQTFHVTAAKWKDFALYFTIRSHKTITPQP